MRYTCDPKKKAANLKKHGYDFDDVPLVIESGHTVTFEDRRFDYGEQRFITLGVLRGDVVAIATAETDRSWTGDRHCPCKPRQAMNGPLTPPPLSRLRARGASRVAAATCTVRRSRFFGQLDKLKPTG